MGNTTNKNLNTLLKKKCLDKDTINTHKASMLKVKKQLEELKKEVENKEEENTKKFINLPKGKLFQFGEYQIYVVP